MLLVATTCRADGRANESPLHESVFIMWDSRTTRALPEDERFDNQAKSRTLKCAGLRQHSLRTM